MHHEWALKNEEEACSVFTLSIWNDMFVSELAGTCGQALSQIMEFEGTRMRWHPDVSQMREISGRLNSGLEKNPGLSGQWRQKTVEFSDRLMWFADALPRDARQLSGDGMAQLIAQVAWRIREAISWGMIFTLADFPESDLTNRLENRLKLRIAELGLKNAPAEYLLELSFEPEENIQQRELRALLKIAAELEVTGAPHDASALGKAIFGNPALKRRVEGHVREFASAYYGYTGPALVESKVIEELAAMLKDEKHAAKELARMEGERAAAIARKKKAAQELQLDAHELKLFSAAQDAAFTKAYRRDACSYALCRLEPILREICRRTGLGWRLVQSARPNEIPAVLANPEKWGPELEAREKYCVYALDEKGQRVISGEDGRKYSAGQLPKHEQSDVGELSGKCACPGKAIGRVKVIDTPAQMAKMGKGDILVSTATQPDIVPAMKKAAAIVTNIGGITSHAAIVARELGVPCVIGTKIATKVFKDGDLVEVDATNGTVRKVRQ